MVTWCADRSVDELTLLPLIVSRAGWPDPFVVVSAMANVGRKGSDTMTICDRFASIVKPR